MSVPAGPAAAMPIRLLVSDVDGTLVTTDKLLTDATVAAVRRLAEHGIGFTIVSSRPPFGLASLVSRLGLTLPFGAYNGGLVTAPDGAVIEEHVLPEAVAREAVRVLTEGGVGVWVFSAGRWLLRDPNGDYVDKERHTIGTEPVVVPEFGPALAHVGKIVGASRDFDRLAALEAELATALGSSASAARSQRYYLDVTPAGISKGSFVETLSHLTGIATGAMAAIGDMDNDVPMLRACGLPIAMGNASAAARRAGAVVVRSNEEDGVADAIDRIILRGER